MTAETEKNYGTTEKAAEDRGVSPRRIRQLLRERRIQGAVKLGRQWIIPIPVVILPPRPLPQEDMLTLGESGNLMQAGS